MLVPGTTPKNPFSGLIAQSLPSSPILIHAMSSPTVQTLYPFIDSGGTSIARFVFPHAEGNAAATYVVLPCGSSIPRMSMCSAIHPSLRPRKLAILSAKHFLLRRTLPPYPDPTLQIMFSSGKCMMYLRSGFLSAVE